MPRVLVTLLALLVVGLAACGEGDQGGGASDHATSGPLDGRTYVATSLTEGGEQRPLVQGSELRLTFGGGRLGIQAGCNTMSGAYTVEDGTLQVADLAATEMGCPDDLMAQDEWIAGVFGHPLAVEQDGGERLTLTAEDTTIELAPREVVSPDASLTDTTWRLETITTGGGANGSASSLPQGVTAKLRINSDGTVEVDTGCNTGVGSAEVDGGSLVFQALGTARKGCADQAAQRVEDAVLAVLDGRVEHEVTEQRLTLTKGDRGLVWRTRE